MQIATGLFLRGSSFVWQELLVGYRGLRGELLVYETGDFACVRCLRELDEPLLPILNDSNPQELLKVLSSL